MLAIIVFFIVLVSGTIFPFKGYEYILYIGIALLVLSVVGFGFMVGFCIKDLFKTKKLRAAQVILRDVP